MPDMTSLPGFEWLDLGFRQPACPTCQGRTGGCPNCRGTGKLAPVFSRVDAIRQAQRLQGHAPCFGRGRKTPQTPVPSRCGETACPHRHACDSLHRPNPLDANRIREDSIELLSRLFLTARGIERRGTAPSPLQSELAGLVERWVDDTPQVAVLGAFSAGKTTLLNRFLGLPLLPTGRTPTTAVVTSLRFGPQMEGTVSFKTRERIGLAAPDRRNPDRGAAEVLRAWIEHPAQYWVDRILELDEEGRGHDFDRKALKRILDALLVASPGPAPGEGDPYRIRMQRRSKVNPEDLGRSFEVTFQPRPDLQFDLGRRDPLEAFRTCLTDPTLAMSIRRASCTLPDPRLASFHLLDTAGLCSPIGFHKEVTARLMERRPDKVLILLDTRRLDNPTTRAALDVLRKFVRVPGDFRHITFGLTFWDLALRANMVEDRETELDFNDLALRQEGHRILLGRKREELKRILASSLDVPCPREIPVHPLGIGEKAPAELQQSVDHLFRSIEEECGSRVAVTMWADRWRAASSFAERLSRAHADMVEAVRDAQNKARDKQEVEREANDIEGDRRALAKGFARAKAALPSVLENHQQLIRTEINRLDAKKGFLDFIGGGHARAFSRLLEGLEAESVRHRGALQELFPAAADMPGFQVDRRILGLDATTKDKVQDEVTGFLYALKSIWDLPFGGVFPLGESNRKAARTLLRDQVWEVCDLLEDHIQGWVAAVDRLASQAEAWIEERRAALDDRRKDLGRYCDGLERKLRFLNHCRKPLEKLVEEVSRMGHGLEEARTRVEGMGRTGFSASLVMEGGVMALQVVGRGDVLGCRGVGGGRLLGLEVVVEGRGAMVYRAATAPGRRALFFQCEGGGDGLGRGVEVPQGAEGIQVRVSNLEGWFIGR